MAETNGLLNRRTGKSGTEGSNPSVSATALFPYIPSHPFKAAVICGFAGDSGPHLSMAIHRCVILRVGTNVGISRTWVDYLQAL